ncbi:MAG: hypothetical protein WC568_07930 [Candidatus Methanoperedens sp.]
MGYAVIMFVALMLMSVVMITAVTYGVAKDSQIAPLKAENSYAERETGKAQTKITIAFTCLYGKHVYTGGGSSSGFGPYTLNLTAKNNGSTVLNPYNSSIFFNLSYYQLSFSADSRNSVPFGDVWTPLISAYVFVPNFYIYSTDDKSPLRLMMAASNGITAIAPTSPTNFSGISIKELNVYDFYWNSSYDETGIAYYLLDVFNQLPAGNCPPEDIINTTTIPGNSTYYRFYCPGSNCDTDFFYLTAVDNEGNMGVQSLTVKCNPSGGGSAPCVSGLDI